MYLLNVSLKWIINETTRYKASVYGIMVNIHVNKAQELLLRAIRYKVD